jgi:hippurate hydrolase
MGGPSPSIVLRDGDVPPLAKQAGLPFTATTWLMHAGGHEMHPAAFVGAAKLLAANRAAGCTGTWC